MKIVTFDCEVFAYDWLVVFKDKATGQYTKIWNDNEAVKACMSDETIFVSFNGKHYDQFIIKAVCADCSPTEVKEINDYIIGGGQGWEIPSLRDFYFKMNNVDVKDDMQMGLSLKAIEGHVGWNIQETEVDFNLDRPLTSEEREQTEFYCCHDVDAAEMVFDLRKNYFKNKVQIGRLAGLDEVKAMGMTNAKLTAALLKASPQKHDDERQYTYPSNLKREYIPQEVFEFFDKLGDESISDKDLFSSKVQISIGDCPITIGFGGIHGAIPNFIWKEGEQ